MNNIKIIFNDTGDVNFHNLFKLVKKLQTAEYLFKFQYPLNMMLKAVPETEDLKVINISGLKVKARLRTKDYKFLMEDVFKGNKSNFEIEDLPTFDINLPKDGKLVCDNCKAEIPKENGAYYCYWDKIYFCAKCVEDKILNEENLKRKYLHPAHNLIYFQSRDKKRLSNIQISRLGKNSYCDRSDYDLKFNHSGSCIGW